MYEGSYGFTPQGSCVSDSYTARNADKCSILYSNQQKFQYLMSILPKLKILLPVSFASQSKVLLTQKYQFILNCIYNPILSTSILCCFNISFSTLYIVYRTADLCKPQKRHFSLSSTSQRILNHLRKSQVTAHMPAHATNIYWLLIIIIFMVTPHLKV